MKKILQTTDDIITRLEESIAIDKFTVETDSPIEKVIVRKMAKFNLHILKFHRDILELIDKQNIEIDFLIRRQDTSAKRIDILENMILAFTRQQFPSHAIQDEQKVKKQ